MSFEESPIIQSRYLKKSKCDKFLSYIENCGDLFVFEGDLTPHGYYDVKISYCYDKNIPLDEMKKHYKNLIDIVIGNEIEF